MEELIYRRDCDLFTESMDWEEMIHDTMTKYGLLWQYEFDEDKIFEFAHEILQNAQNVIDTAETIGYEKDRIGFNKEGTLFTYTKYLTYEENDNED